MTQEEKQLLTVDICSRFPYGLKVWDEVSKNSYKVVLYEPDKREVGIRHLENSELKPILFPTSCIIEEITVRGRTFTPIEEIGKIYEPNGTFDDGVFGWGTATGGDDYQDYSLKWNDERKVFEVHIGSDDDSLPLGVEIMTIEVIDYMNANFIDYRGLIPACLAVSVFELSDNPYK